MKVTLILFGGPCAGRYEAESPWPPPRTIQAVHDHNGYMAVLDRPDDQVLLGEEVVEYELSSWGHMCGRGHAGGGGCRIFASYMRAGLAGAAKTRAAARELRHLEAVPA